MSLSTYTELKSDIADWINRDDLTARIPDFIRLAEAEFNDELRHWRMEKRAETTLDGRFIALPTDWQETTRFRLNVAGKSKLEFISLDEMEDKREKANDSAGTPEYFTYNAGQIELFPTPDGSYSATLGYYAQIDNLSASTATNWLLDNYPNVYLYGALTHTAPFLKEDERIQVWAAMYQAATNRLNKGSKRATTSASGLKMNIKSY